MEKFNKIIITLLANVGTGRYKLRYHEYDIVKDTPKTVIVQRTGKPSIRQQKKDMLKVKSDYRNDTLSKIQFYTTCYASDMDEARKNLENAMMAKVQELHGMNVNALEAFSAGCKLEKIES